MKTIIHLCVIATLSFATLSCKKSDLPQNNLLTATNNDAVIDSRIDRFILEPTSMELGTPDAIIHEGDRVTIFLPYEIVNENFVSAMITMTDDATGLPVNTYDMVSSKDPTASQLVLPENLMNNPEFFFVTFVANEDYTGKTISVTTKLVGNSTFSTDVLNAAFSVEH